MFHGRVVHRPILKDIKKSLEGHIVLDCDVDLLIPILKQAKEVNLLDDYHSFIITSLVSINRVHALNGFVTGVGGFLIAGRTHDRL